MLKILLSLTLQTVALVVFSFAVHAQNNCQPPEIVVNKNAYNIFSEEQEMFLGEAMAERFRKDFRVIEDEAVNSQVRRIGDKIVKHLPPTNLKFQFTVVDLPEVNAFTMAGGRIYVTRKLIAFVRNEDELAGIIAHELGHGIVRHTAIDSSKLFKEILGVEKVTNKQDVFKKYNQLIDKQRTKFVSINRNHENEQQLEADRIAVFAMIAAGYDPNAFTSAWDRLADTQGKTGNWFTDVFGSTSPGQKRLREIIKAIESMPAECLDKKSTFPAEDFKAWQSLAINYANLYGKEKVNLLLSKKSLNPNLRGDVTNLEFSQDGKFILAQDDSGISVVQKEPFKHLFRIEVSEARTAKFTPDSKSIVFNTTNKRVEKWSISEQKPVVTREVFVRDSCLQTALSNDGKIFLCFSLNPNFEINLEILDVETNQTILKKEKFYRPYPPEFISLIFAARESNDEIDAFQVEFSPDGRYFVAGRVLKFSVREFPLSSFLSGTMVLDSNQEGTMGFDLVEKKEIKLGNDLRNVIASPFAFYSNDKIIGQDRKDENKSGIFAFPTGARREKFFLRGDSFTKPHKGDYVLVRPLKTAPVGVFDIKANKIVITNKNAALAVYDNTFVSEMKTGELGLFRLDKDEELGTVSLPKSRFGNLRAVVVSPDLNWLAVSGKERGAVWSLYSGKMAFYVRGFRGAFFDKDGKVYADFTKTEATERQTTVMDLRTTSLSAGAPIEMPNTKQHGKYLVTMKSNKEANDKNKKDNEKESVTEKPDDFSVLKDGKIEVRDVRLNSLLWTKNYPDEVPQYSVSASNNTVTLTWQLNSKFAKNEVKKDEKLRQTLSNTGSNNGDYLVQVIEAETGNLVGQALIETGEGSFRIREAFAAVDWLTVTDTANRVLFYSLKTGELRHRFFGGKVAVSAKNNLAAIENLSGQVSVYNLNSGIKLDEMTFKTPIAFIQFSADGKKLFILTAEQEAFLIDATKFGSTSSQVIR